jgi:hypothetical protein
MMAAYERYNEIEQRVAATPARTLAGFVAEARCHAWLERDGRISDCPLTDPVHSIMQSLVNKPMEIDAEWARA